MEDGIKTLACLLGIEFKTKPHAEAKGETGRYKRPDVVNVVVEEKAEVARKLSGTQLSTSTG